MRAVRFHEFGSVDVLQVEEVPDPVAGAGRVVVRVRAAGINIGESKIRRGDLESRFPTTFPCGEGSDFAGVVAQVGDEVTAFAVGDEVLGWTDQRGSHAELVSAPVDQVVAKPAAVPWEVAGGLYVAGGAATGTVTALDPSAGQTIVVSGAAGGVGLIAVQLLRERGVRVLAVASADSQQLLEGFGAELVDRNADIARQVRDLAPGGVDGWIDVYGPPYVQTAIDLGVAPERIDTIADFEGAAAHPGVQTVGTSEVASAAMVAGLAERVADGRLAVPVVGAYALDDVRAAYAELERGGAHGKIVLLP